MKTYKIAFLISHPIQYNSPLFKKMADHPQIDLTVLYCSDESVRVMKDRDFGREVKWDIDLLEGYNDLQSRVHTPAWVVPNTGCEHIP